MSRLSNWLFDNYLDKFYVQVCPNCGEYCISYSQRKELLGVNFDCNNKCSNCGIEIQVTYKKSINYIRYSLYVVVFILAAVSLAIPDLYWLGNIYANLVLLNILARYLIYIPFSDIKIIDETQNLCAKKIRAFKIVIYIIVAVVIFILYYKNVYLVLSS